MKNQLAILGLGSQTTTFYISELNRLYQEEKGGFSTCPFVMLNTNFDEINSLLPNVSNPLKTIVQNYIHQIETYKSDYVLIPNITLHQTIDCLTISPKIIHPIQLCMTQLKQNNITKTTLFGTKYTMHSAYILDCFSQQNIAVEIPKKEDFNFIENFRNKVYNQEETPDLIAHYQEIVKTHTSQNPVVLACTELSIHNKIKQNVYDIVGIQIKEAIKIVTENKIKK